MAVDIFIAANEFSEKFFRVGFICNKFEILVWLECIVSIIDHLNASF